MLFRQLFDSTSSTYTYLVADEGSGEALLIDPVRERIERDVKLVSELGLRLVYSLDTHVHADHVTAAGQLRERFGVRTVAGIHGADCANLMLGHGDVLQLGSLGLQVLETPGHTDDSVCYRMADRVFTGDTLLVRGCGRADFQNGDPVALHDSITRVLFALPDATLVFPAHDYKGMTVTTIGEEKRHNPRLAGKTREQFVAIMNSLGLPPPAKLAEALPANRACGLPSTDTLVQG
jgi:sulfur dioxygenase